MKKCRCRLMSWCGGLVVGVGFCMILPGLAVVAAGLAVLCIGVYFIDLAWR